MRLKIEDLSEDAAVAVETLIETALEVREQIPFFLKFAKSSSYFARDGANWNAVIERLQSKSGNLSIPKGWVARIHSQDRFLYIADKVKAFASELELGAYSDLNFFNLKYDAEKLKGTFLYYATEEQIDALFELQHQRLEEFFSKIKNISVKQDARKPFKAISKAFNDLCKAEIGERFYSDKENQQFLFTLAASEEIQQPDILAYRELLYAAAFEAFESYKIDSRELLYGAMARILDTKGIDVTHGIMKLHIELLFTDEELVRFGKEMPRIQSKPEGLIKVGEIKGIDIRPSNRLSEVYREEVNRTGSGQQNTSSFQGSPYPDSVKNGRQRFAFRKNFE